METQKIIWTVLPNGYSKNNPANLSFSVFVSPRLSSNQSNPSLGLFEDFLDWPKALQGIDFGVQFGNNAPVAATRVGPTPDSDLWKAMFTKDGEVYSYEFPKIEGKTMRSYATKNVEAWIKEKYQGIILSSPEDLPPSADLAKELEPIMFYAKPVIEKGKTAVRNDGIEMRALKLTSTPPKQMEKVSTRVRTGKGLYDKKKAKPGQTRLQTGNIHPQLNNVLGNVPNEVFTNARLDLQHLAQEPTIPFKAVTLNALSSMYNELASNYAIDNSGPVEPTKDFLQISLFHRPKQPHVVAVAIPSFDFHEACSSLSNFPEIMRRIGLVIDLEVPASAVAGNTVRLLPHTAGSPIVIGNLWNGADPTQNVRPLTRYTHNAGSKTFTATPKGGSDIENGMVKLDDNKYSLTTLDVDGAALKLLALANTLRHYAAPDLKKKKIASLDPVAVSANISPNEFASTGLVLEEASLPALRTAGISLIKTNQALNLIARVAHMGQLNLIATPAADDALILWADDLVKGYRVDIRDSESNTWRSLCKRKGSYFLERLNQTITHDDEGWVELGAASAADQEVEELQKSWYVPELLTAWTGWSKVAPQPGKKIVQPADPSQDDTWNDNSNTSETDYGLATNFRAEPGTLPRLRYGVGYRMRARVVDIAGNGLTLEDAPSGTAQATDEIVYRRYEPIPAPFLIPKTGIKPGESVEHLVVRSNYNKTAEEYAALFPIPNHPAYPADRHIVPSRQAQRMAEDYGLFDDPNTKRPDPNKYNTIINNDAFFPPFDPKKATQGVKPEGNVGVPWLPDMAEGTTFRGLPGTATNAITKVAYGSPNNWPDIDPVILRLTEGEGAPSGPIQEGGINVITVKLPKATMRKSYYSSYVNPSELPRMEVWEWLSGKPGVTQQKAADGLIWSITPHRGLTLTHVVQQPLEQPVIASLKGDKKLGDTFAMLTGKVNVHGASSSNLDVYAEWDEPIDNLALPGPKTLKKKNLAFQEGIGFDDESYQFPPPPETKTAAAISKKMIGKKSFSVLGAAKTLTSYKVQQTPELGLMMTAGSTRKKSGNMVKSGGAGKAMTFGKLGFTTKPDERIRHDFGDTKYRRVSYRGVSASRFREYFLDIIPDEIPKYDTLDLQQSAEADSTNLLLTRTGDVKTIDILNSARPAAPKVLYVIPSFAWEKESEGDQVRSKRVSGLRIWLDRPWYSSGDGELLGVVVWPSTGPKKGASSSPKGKKGPGSYKSKTNSKSMPSMSKMGLTTKGGGKEVPERLLPYVTQWGADPIWMGGRLRSLPNTNDFLAADAVDSGLSMAEFPGQGSDEFVSVAAYDVGYDKERRLWYCDIEVNPHEAYFPFLRLALARYQPKSVVDAHLSRIVMADYIQVTPDRSVTLTFDPSDARKVRVALTGVTYRASAAGQFASEVEITVETATGPDGDLEWIPADGNNSANIDRISGIGSKLWDGLWAGEIKLPFDRGSQPARLVIREFEVLLGDGSSPAENFGIDGATMEEIQMAGALNPDLRRRLVYADVVEIS